MQSAHPSFYLCIELLPARAPILSTGVAIEQRTHSLRKELLSVLFVSRGPCLCMSFSVCAETPSIIPFVLIGSYITTGTGAPIRTKRSFCKEGHPVGALHYCIGVSRVCAKEPSIYAKVLTI